MSDVFISYSRKDSDFVRRLHDALADLDREVWVDWKDIPLTADWWHEICTGIEASDTFLFVITPDSLASPICNMEIAHALHHNKRLVTIVRHQVEQETATETLARIDLDDNSKIILAERDLIAIARRNWLSLMRHNWLFFEQDSDFEANFRRLIDAIDTDLAHVRMHTKLLIRAIEWENKSRNSSFLLTGIELKEANFWLSAASGKDPHPTQGHVSYIIASQRNISRRQRFLFIAATASLGLFIGLTIFSFMLFGRAIDSLNFSNETEHVLETQLADVVATRDAYATLVFEGDR